MSQFTTWPVVNNFIITFTLVYLYCNSRISRQEAGFHFFMVLYKHKVETPCCCTKELTVLCKPLLTNSSAFPHFNHCFCFDFLRFCLQWRSLLPEATEMELHNYNWTYSLSSDRLRNSSGSPLSHQLSAWVCPGSQCLGVVTVGSPARSQGWTPERDWTIKVWLVNIGTDRSCLSTFKKKILFCCSLPDRLKTSIYLFSSVVETPLY